MKLYYAPGACSLGIHVLLEEIGRPYELERADLRVPAPERPLTQVNPKSKVPTLVRDNGTVLTEYPAIAFWLARTNPEKNLIPTGFEGEARTLEAMEFCVATMHMQGFRLLFMARRAPAPEEAEAIAVQGRAVAQRGLEQADAMLGGKEWLVDQFSIADSALYYCCHWADRGFGMTLPSNVAAHYARMVARPSVQAALQQEGIA